MIAGNVVTSLSLIRKFNRHSELVLKSCSERRKRVSHDQNYQEVRVLLDLQDQGNRVIRLGSGT